MLVLASASPRREELLRNAGIPFVVQAANIDETLRAGEAPRDYAERLAREKALAVWKARRQDVVLGADTIVVVDETVLGKPRDGVDAIRMLHLLSGRVHQVITGVCIVKPEVMKTGVVKPEVTKSGAEGPAPAGSFGKELRTASEVTLVSVAGIADDEIRAYVATGEPMDKAGGYAIQGMASRWIPRIEGDYSNVVGLPVALVYRMLREMENPEISGENQIG